MPNPANNKVDSRSRVLGRLVSLNSQYSSIAHYLGDSSSESTSSIIIHFPSLPEVIELARSAEYRVSSSYVMPDGAHQYKLTNPLEIPFSFSLHHTDPFCSRGPVSLLIMSAKLHALVLPINSSRERSNIWSTSAGPGVKLRQSLSSPGQPPTTNQDSSQRSTEEGRTKEISDEIQLKNESGLASTAFPPTVFLDLMSSGDDGPGIRCIGYVKNINVALRGPWLQGRDPKIVNLPTSGEFRFTFVHHPSHTNYFNPSSTDISQLEIGAFADDVRTRLYDTVDLRDASQAYIGLGESPPADIEVIDTSGAAQPLQ